MITENEQLLRPSLPVLLQCAMFSNILNSSCAWTSASKHWMPYMAAPSLQRLAFLFSNTAKMQFYVMDWVNSSCIASQNFLLQPNFLKLWSWVRRPCHHTSRPHQSDSGFWAATNQDKNPNLSCPDNEWSVHTACLVAMSCHNTRRSQMNNLSMSLADWLL